MRKDTFCTIVRTLLPLNYTTKQTSVSATLSINMNMHAKCLAEECCYTEQACESSSTSILPSHML